MPLLLGPTKNLRWIRPAAWALVFGAAAASWAAPVDTALYEDLRWRLVGPLPGRLGDVRRGNPGRARDLLLRRGGGRGLEDGGCRSDVGPDLRS